MGEEDSRRLPTSDLDFNLMMVDSLWGRQDVPQELKDRLNELVKEYDPETGAVKDKTVSLWGILGHYTRDLRLANLSEDELRIVRYMLDLAADYLSVGLKESFTVALSRAISILETSQSKKGFLRKQMNTLRQEHTQETIAPKKKRLWGGSTNNGGG
jgi:hypothetical protein